MWGGGGKRRQTKGGDAARNSHSVGPRRHGHGLFRWPYLRRTFQPRRYPCFRLLQEVPLETGTPQF